MKITIDKNYVEDYQMSRVKEDVEDFKASWKEKDLLEAFTEQTELYVGYGVEILKTKIEAMDSGWATGNRTVFKVEMVLDDNNRMHKIRFYIDNTLEVDTRVLYNGMKMYTIRTFEEA